MDYLKLVEEINMDFFKLIENKDPELTLFIEENPPLSIKSVGFAHAIDFFGLNIWCSENDERPYENEDDPELCDQMDLGQWIWQEIMRISFLMKKLNEYIY